MKEYLPQVIATAITIFITPTSKYIVGKIVKKYGLMTLKSEPRTLHVVNIINILINIGCIVTLAIIWGVRPQNMLIAVSSVFAVIGVAFFAQWSLLSNMTAGIIIFFTAPFRIGDQIQILDKDMPIDATIEIILTFYTHLRTKEGELIVIPNSLFLQKMVSIGKEKEKEY
ncbi:MscS family membrane protein [Dysgonomonas sp. PFB1-18]|uniref:mechanosensitive ion channel domain-containing protein n=1 Tax=unclassified Dysgonomonas TaxID=2630389 RepID=UPI0024744694|nr:MULTISPECIES: mechanosensitive ion channel domain-containing protein [unclassified Dysgonomonas]MDH6310839.1 MscS family membrane protein [Dysgonomonas sp. PF1-14]MDH6340723.1 MscS family membrane protein [Dysgonomonas sp. PF1-16]MDH6382309.1 MscS family membrane protein [Dysgonomonas sp. PFB1-18]MDH6399659.1 MscS family membrane protein [Dysgonomonas sp. PF1-23]